VLEQSQIFFLKKNSHKKTNKELAQIMGLKYSSVRYYRAKLGLHKQQIKPYTDDEIKYLKANFRKLGNKEMQVFLNRSIDSIRKKLKSLNLKRTPEELKNILKKPNNGHFSKGRIPDNLKEIGTVSIRSDKNNITYKYIKVDKDNWELYHRFLWKKEKGIISDDEIIVFKDGNQMNCVVENLESITKEENMYRNAKYNYPKEIIPSLVLLNKINKKINSLEDGTE
jgi:hypothetical protein